MQQNISFEKVIFNSKKEDTVNREYVLPEYLPGILKIIKASVLFDGCEFSAQDEKPCITCNAKIHIVYLSDYSAELKSVIFDESFTFQFKEVFKCDTDYTAIPSIYISGISATPLSGRKIKFKCTFHPACTVYAEKSTSVFLPDEGNNNICALESETSYCNRFFIKSDFLTSSAELTLEKTSPCAKDVIFPKVSIHSVNAVCSDEKIKINAKLSLYALYRCTDDDADENSERKYSAVSSQADFEAEISDVRIKDGQLCTCFVDINSVECTCSFDGFGESRIITFETKYTVNATVYENKSIRLAEDVFSLSGECNPDYEKLSLYNVHEPLTSNISCTETVHTDIGALDKISVCFASISKVTKEKTSENCFAAVLCRFEIIGISAGGELVSLDFPVTFHVPVEKCDIDEAEPDFLLSVKDVKADISDGNIKATADFSMNGIYKLPFEIRAVTSIETTSEQSEPKKAKNRITVCYPSKDDSIWAIAKKHKVNPSQLRKINNLEDDAEKADRIIIIY